MLALEMNAGTAPFGVVSRPMLYMVLRPMGYLLSVDPDQAMTVHATNVFGRGARNLSNRNFLPTPLTLIANDVLSALLTPKHQIMWHRTYSETSLLVIADDRCIPFLSRSQATSDKPRRQQTGNDDTTVKDIDRVNVLLTFVLCSPGALKRATQLSPDCIKTRASN